MDRPLSDECTSSDQGNLIRLYLYNIKMFMIKFTDIITIRKPTQV